MTIVEQFYKINTWYSITINPCDKYQFFGNIDRLQKFRNYFYELFVSNWCQYEMFIELSEPRGTLIYKYQGPRLHLHGKIKFSGKAMMIAFLLDGVRRLCHVGSIDIDSIDDTDVWLTYCTKQKHLHSRITRLSNYTL